MGKLSRDTAIDYLKKIYNNVASNDVDMNTIYQNLGLDQNNRKERDRIYEWLGSLKDHGFAEKRHTKQNKLKGLRLTPSGHLAVRGIVGEESIDKEARLKRWKADAKALQILYPEFEVVYDMRLRKEVTAPQQDEANRNG